MVSVLKVIANTQAITSTNNNINSARLVRVNNIGGAATANVACFDTVGNTQLWFVQVSNTEVVYLEKNATDALTSNVSTTTGTSVAFRN